MNQSETVSHEAIRASGYGAFDFAGASADYVRAMHRFMLRLRKCEEVLVKEYHPADEMRCPVHFCIGQEAVPAALSLLLRADDYLFSHHRSHGYYLAKGCPMDELFAELYGKATGANGGKAGSQDISSSRNRFYSGAILSGSIAISTGTALGIRHLGGDNVSVAGFGEGATDEGVFWEAVSYAVLKQLPLILVCENNKYATVSPQTKRQKHLNICERAESFGIETEALFGNDVVAVYKTLRERIARVRAGEGPFLLEAYTYRWNGHVGPEDDSHINYRTDEEIQFWTEHCPIKLLEQHYPDQWALSGAEDVEAIDAEIAAAFAFAKASAWPTVENWRDENHNGASPRADQLLPEIAPKEFDRQQDETIPGPY